MSFMVECGGQKWRLDDGNYIIGRHSDCDLRIADGRLSRQHARLTLAGSRAQVVDLGSRNGVFVDDQAQNQRPSGPEHSVRIGPFRLRLRPLHQGVATQDQDADFLPMAAASVNRQALTDTFDERSSASAEVRASKGPDAGASTKEMLSDAFAPQTQTRLGSTALASSGWFRLPSSHDSTLATRAIAFLGDVGLQFPIAVTLGCVSFLAGLLGALALHTFGAAEQASVTPTDGSQIFITLLQPETWLSLSVEILAGENQSAGAVWLLGLSCGVCLTLGWLTLVLILPTIASGGPYWHRHYNLQICTARGERPAAWQVCLRWGLILPLAPLTVPMALVRLPGFHDLIAGTRLRSE